MKNEDKNRDGLEDLGILYLSGSLDDHKSEALSKQIIEMNMRTLDSIQLIINSPGGSVSAGFALLDVMAWSRLPIRTTGLGQIASMGLMVFMAGTPGHRVITSRVSILSHRFSWWAVGNHSELLMQRKEIDLTHQRILAHYRQHTRLKTDDAIQTHLLRDVDSWLTPDEAVKFGIADIIEAGGAKS
ncbi:MAG: ATP-dependent Clp protease proteolytic subunit [Deltaproteobacteria bacterium]|nr:ATP-dependent Clp protease proteolytic subunit [Deltaproteobacteria bacterium]